MAELIEHVRTLAEEIGPRPATTDAEHRAAEWLEKTFAGHGLPTEMHEFDAPRTYAWAYVIYHLLTLLCAFFAGFKPAFAWPAFAISAIVAYFMWSDLDTRWGLTRLMPKGPSQNVIARHVPRSRRGEKLRKVVIVAHYDSARASLAFSPSMVGGFATTFGLMKWCTYLVPVGALLIALPLPSQFDKWLWYATMAISAYLIVPLLINIHRELFMPFVEGANDNASGVAAMLGVMQRLIAAPDANSLATGSFPTIRRDAETAWDAGVVPEGSGLSYTPAGAPESTELPDDFAWAEPVPQPSRSQGTFEFDTIDFGSVADAGGGRRRAPRGTWSDESEDAETTPGSDVLPSDVDGPAPDEADERGRERGGLFSRLGRKRGEQRPREEVKDWLGVEEDFDARKAGKDIGSWDKFGDDDDDDAGGLGWKGGWAGDDPVGDPEFAATEAARIRRKVTEGTDRELSEKEVWFVATGCEESGTHGMQALLRDYADDLRDALIINIDGCGAGQLYWASSEGMARKYRPSQRLVGLARRVSRETETMIKPRAYKGLSTDATPAMARGFKVVSIMAFDAKGLPVNWHWRTDTVDRIDPELIETTADFVTAMVREA